MAILRLIRLEWPISELWSRGKICPEVVKIGEQSHFGPKSPVKFEPCDQKIFGQASILEFLSERGNSVGVTSIVPVNDVIVDIIRASK